MKFSPSGSIILSPSDALRFQSCRHATTLDLAFLRGEPVVPAEDDPSAALLQKKGFEHEAKYLGKLQNAHSRVVTIDNDKLKFDEAFAQTAQAMADGEDVIFQGALEWGTWRGFADFIERVDAPSGLGSFSYEPVDTKLKRKADPKHAIQLSIYARALERLQGKLPVLAHVVLGDETRVSFKLEHTVHFTDHLAGRLEQFVGMPYPTRSEPVRACELCRWRTHCAEQWEKSDSLVLVAGIRSSQRKRLEAAGIATVEALAGNKTPVPGMSPAILGKLRAQARLQHSRRIGGPPQYVLRDADPLRGLALLPRPSEGDLFFDMEGDPLADGGLEYLFGVYREVGGKPNFKSWWAHDQGQEKNATAQVLAFFVDHLARYPDAFIYHYNHYEVTALKRLASKYGTGEHHLDHLLRTRRFVDLYRVVAQSIITSEPGLSIKDLEVFYRPKREEDVKTAGASIVAYEDWRETNDNRILEAIEEYNKVDCISTKGLRDWLVEKVRPAGIEWLSPTVEGEAPPPEDPVREMMRDFIAPARARIGDELADLLLELNAFHKRADKPSWWEYFDRQNRDADELIDDLECLASLIAVAPAVGSMRTYKYPRQETKLRENDRVGLRGSNAMATIREIDRAHQKVSVEFSKRMGEPPDHCDLIPGKPLQNEVLRKAVRRATSSIVANDGRFPAVLDFLGRRRPRITGVAPNSPIVAGNDVVEDTVQAIRLLDRSCLPIQGPPGTGKTYVSSCAILDLVRDGRRIAVSSNSHKAIDNLLLAVAERARESGMRISIAKKVSTVEGAIEDPMVYVATENGDAALHAADVVGGTAWLFARPEFEQEFDVLFVDEAGQVSIANLVAMATAAQNLVLVGDQMQLPQPIQGVHPGNSGMSSLEYVLRDAQTVAADKGIFLPVSRRLHPDVCAIVSRIAYDGRLVSDEGTKRHKITLKDPADSLPSTGVVFFDVGHEGNAQTSEEEAARLRSVYDALLGSNFTDRDGAERRISVDDILVVSPYNAQVNLLIERLPKGARVGTVDRFQGQEAPACLISMATSSEAEMPRDIEFLFSLNRLNVAISRAQALAAIFCSPRLLDVTCNTLDELRLVNALCAVRSSAASAGSALSTSPAVCPALGASAELIEAT